MDDELERIKKLTAFMRKAGLLTLKSGNLELCLSPQVFHEEQNTQASGSSPSEDAALKSQFSEEEILFWSSPGVLPDTESEIN